ncbi:hypothetical protein DdX_04199 [Ditylenchus destructor]|uniref:Uncharacterized protein n=1 Tax=Ditylenchus destructor TaxID=166010 RepID=A0AAD4RAX6_9BILA|nr:hypothetical protein DdX_04199 [Ditylenchus destructor]
MIWVSSSVLIPSTILLLLLVHESNCDLSEEDNPSSDWYIDLADYFLYNTLIVSDDKEVKRFGFSDKTTQLVMLPQLRLLIAALEKQAKELRWSLKSQSTGTNEQAIKHIEALLETNMKDTKKEALRKKLAQFEAIKKMREENLKNHVPELVITALDVIEKFVKANTVELSKPDFKKELDMLNGRVEELRALQAMLASLKVPHATVVPDPFAGVQKPKIMWPNSSVIQREVQLQIELYNKYTDVLGSKVLFFRKIKTLKTEMMKERCVIYENVRALIER